MREKRTKKAAQARPEGPHYHLRLPVELDEFLKNFARDKGFEREVEAVRQIIRDRREVEQAAA